MYKLCNLKYHQSVLLSALVLPSGTSFLALVHGLFAVNLSEPDDLHRPMWICRAVEWKFLRMGMFYMSSKLCMPLNCGTMFRFQENNYYAISYHAFVEDLVCCLALLSKGPTALPDSPSDSILSVGPPTRIKYTWSFSICVCMFNVYHLCAYL